MIDRTGFTYPTPDETGMALNQGVRIAWKRYGEGPQSILFMPTWNFVDSRVLRHQVVGLRDRFRLITYDARGSGESDHPGVGYRFDDHASDALAVMEATRTLTASIVAASAGTHAAVLMATRHPELVERLVLIVPPMDLVVSDATPVPARPISTSGDDDPGVVPPAWRTDYAAFVDWFLAEVFSEPGSASTIAEVTSIALEADHDMLVQQATELDWDAAPAVLHEIRCQTLVIHGEADRTLDVATVRAVVERIPGARLALLAGLGHRPDIRRPDIVNPILAEFVTGSKGRRPPRYPDP
ncbi:MAG: alpha/beta hydrolase [Chloroflexota bacterium]